MEDKNLATRPLSIIEARFNLEAKQNDIIDMLLVQIKNDDNMVYEINIDKYKDIYKSNTSNIYRDMKKAVKGFEKKGFHTIINGEETWFAWFTKITYRDSQGKILLKIDPDLKELLTEVKQRISYDIEGTLNCVSKYSKRMYYYLKLYEDTGWRIDKIQSLCEKLECPKSYLNDYSKFKEKVLRPAYQEINNITDINFEFEEIKEGRKTTRLKFRIKSKAISERLIESKSPLVSVGVDDLLNGILSKENIIKVENILEPSFKSKKVSEAQNPIDFLSEKIDYVNKKYPKKISDESSYVALLLSALKGDWVLKKLENDDKTNFNKSDIKDSKVKQLKFHNFEGRNHGEDYYNDLEKKFQERFDNLGEVAVGSEE